MNKNITYTLLILFLCSGLCSLYLYITNTHLRDLNISISQRFNNSQTILNTAISFKKRYPFIKDLILQNDSKSISHLSENIEGQSTNILLLKITDCRECFDKFVKEVTQVSQLVNPPLKIIFVSDDFNDYSYFNKFKPFKGIQTFWSKSLYFEEYYNLGIPILLRLNQDLHVEDMLYLNKEELSLGLVFLGLNNQ